MIATGPAPTRAQLFAPPWAPPLREWSVERVWERDQGVEQATGHRFRRACSIAEVIEAARPGEPVEPGSWSG